MGDKDDVFQRLLDDEQLFLRFLRRFLRDQMPEAIDVDSLTPDDIHQEKTTFLPPEVSRLQTDVLYRIRRGSAEVYVYILIEHQSSVNYLMPFRLLSYMVQFWRSLVEKAGREAEKEGFRLPPVLPVVYYEGQDRWTVSTRFADKIRDASDFGKHVPDFEYHLISLRDKSSEELLTVQDALGTLCYLSNPMRAEELDEAAERLLRILASFTPEERDLVERHLHGYLKIQAKKAGGDAKAIFDRCLEGKGVVEMLARLRDEIAELRQKERLAVCEETAVRMLERGLAISLISETTGVSEERLRELARGGE